jgi:hypothetical protein
VKRRLVLILLLLAGGAIVNVAVAWGCALYPYPGPAFGSSPRGFYDYVDEAGNRTWLIVRFGQLHISQHVGQQPLLMPERIDLSAYQNLVPAWSAFSSGNPTGDHVDGRGNVTHIVHYEELAVGWPAFAFRASAQRTGTGADHSTTGLDLTGSHVPLWFRRMHLGAYLPVRPIWLGFAINTAFYAFVLWLLFAAPFALRRWRRIKRGLCPACAYPVGESDVCTECGASHAVKRRVVVV